MVMAQYFEWGAMLEFRSLHNWVDGLLHEQIRINQETFGCSGVFSRGSPSISALQLLWPFLFVSALPPPSQRQSLSCKLLYPTTALCFIKRGFAEPPTRLRGVQAAAATASPGCNLGTSDLEKGLISKVVSGKVCLIFTIYRSYDAVFVVCVVVDFTI